MADHPRIGIFLLHGKWQNTPAVGDYWGWNTYLKLRYGRVPGWPLVDQQWDGQQTYEWGEIPFSVVSYNGAQDPRGSAVQVAYIFRKFVEQHGLDAAVVMTHSMGGVVARIILSHQGYTWPYAVDTFGGARPGRILGWAEHQDNCTFFEAHTWEVIALAAPQRGSELANAATRRWFEPGTIGGYALEWFGERTKSTRYLRTSNMAHQNRTKLIGTPESLLSPQTGSVSWGYSAASLGGFEVLNDSAHAEDFVLAVLANLGFFPSPNDGLVADYSASAVGYPFLFGPRANHFHSMRFYPAPTYDGYRQLQEHWDNAATEASFAYQRLCPWPYYCLF